MTEELYKKHRPKTLERMVGNHTTVESLRSMIAGKKVPHTILFHGPSGCGKTTLARIVANELGCHKMDIREMNCSSSRGIDAMREIMQVMNLAPTGGTCRVWILDEVHQLSKDAQHSALKMLEDTPAHVYFFLCTTEPKKLLPTIQTRCSQMPVALLSDEEATSLVKRVAKKINFPIGKKSLKSLIKYAAGSARSALVLLDKIRNLTPDEQESAMEAAKDEETAAIDLCRALLRKERWPEIAKILRTLNGDAEQVRRAVLGYARAILLGKGDQQAYVTICAFEDNFYDSGDAGLVRACWEATHGN